MPVKSATPSQTADQNARTASTPSCAGLPSLASYGHGDAVKAGFHFMAHKTGFTEKSLTQALQAAGFQSIAGKRRSRGLDLWMLASKGRMPEPVMRELAGTLLPS